MRGLRDVEIFLKRHVCESDDNDVLMFYGDLYKYVGADAENIGDRNRVHDLLGQMSMGEHRLGRPLLSVVVVTQENYTPGPGFFGMAREANPNYSGLDNDAIFIKELKRVQAMRDFYCAQIEHL